MVWILALTLLLVTFAITGVISAKIWWFPVAASELAGRFDEHFMLTLASTGFFFVLSQVVLVYIIIRFRGTRSQAVHSRGTAKLVWAVVGVMAILDVILAVGSEGIWARQHLDEGLRDTLRIELTGQQFAWNFRYPGPDGKFGRTDLKLIDDVLGNPVGLDLTDDAAKDDIVIPTVIVPINRPIELLLRSKDVLHSLFLRELRIKQDLVPGMQIPLRFTANRLGRYEVACAELCGLGHHRMRTFLEVLEPDEFERRLAESAPQY